MMLCKQMMVLRIAGALILAAQLFFSLSGCSPESAHPPEPAPIPAPSGNEVNNGGDSTAMAFIQRGYLVVAVLQARYAKRIPILGLSQLDLSLLEKSINETRIVATNDPIRDDQNLPVEARNIPDPSNPGKRMIELYRPTWEKHFAGDNQGIFGLVLHEYFLIIGKNDKNYVISRDFVLNDIENQYWVERDLHKRNLLLFRLPLDREPVTELTGRWESKCVALGGDKGSHKTDMIFGGVLVEKLYQNFTDRKCHTRTLTVHITGVYKISRSGLRQYRDEHLIWFEGEVDFDHLSVKVTPFDAGTAASLNAPRYCGMNNWNPGVARECSPQKRRLYDIVAWKEGLGLHFGRIMPGDSHGNSSDDRPKMYDTDRALFKKVN